MEKLLGQALLKRKIYYSGDKRLPVLLYGILYIGLIRKFVSFDLSEIAGISIFQILMILIVFIDLHKSNIKVTNSLQFNDQLLDDGVKYFL